jgi:formylglycine-generating enzyme required for sulfatase activity
MKNAMSSSISIILIFIFMAGCVATIPPPTPISTTGSLASEAETAKPIPSPTIPSSQLGDSQIRQIDGMQMVYVPAGEFRMGSESEEVDFALQQCRNYGTNCQRSYFSVEMPAHQVTLDGFWLNQTEVTGSQYSLCEAAGVCESPQCQSANGDHPIVCVTWEQAVIYCQWASGRLPTEAEWEYAARGPNGIRYPWGDDFDGTLLNYCDANCTLPKQDETFNDGYAETAPVGSYSQGASWVGVLDMAGNVWEMVADWNGGYPAGEQVNPEGPLTGSRRVARGGSWHASPDHVRSTVRTHLGVEEQFEHVGFRCAQSAP